VERRVASLLLGSLPTTWLTRRLALIPGRFVLGHLADDVAYGIGIYAGPARNRTIVSVRPVISWRPFRRGAGLGR